MIKKTLLKIINAFNNTIKKDIDVDKSQINEVDNSNSSQENTYTGNNISNETKYYVKDPDFYCAEYIEVDIMNPYANIEKNQVTIVKNGLCKEEIHVLPNELVDYGGPIGDNIWIGKKIGEGEVTLVGPKYYIENQKNVYHIVKVKVYNSKNNDYNSYISYLG